MAVGKPVVFLKMAVYDGSDINNEWGSELPLHVQIFDGKWYQY
jgi:hypothetical protein